MTDKPVSMPWSAPVFPAPPHSWTGVRSVVLPFTPDREAVQAVLPPVFEVADGPGLVTILTRDWGDNVRFHPFNEAVVVFPVRCQGEEGSHGPFLYVTTDEALITGRETAGWPSRIADIRWEREGDDFHASVTRWGETILSVEGRLNVAPPDGAEASVLVGGTGKPMFNYKLIPGPGDQIEIEEVTSTTLDVVVRGVETGTARLIATSTVDDPLASVVPSGEVPLIALMSDNTIPRGRVIRRIDPRDR